jgi:tRNA A37 threonylcarbamoyladenosine modification protein TsaB
MITKQQLQHEFPSFDIHEANFTQTRYYMLVKGALHFHVEIDKDNGNADVLIYVEGEKINKEIVATKDALDVMYQELKQIAKKYDNTRD